MAGSVNKIILVGNVGRDPEIRNAQDGTKIANFSVATSETWRDKATGERKDKTQWHRVVIFNDRLADVAQQYVKKGMKVYYADGSGHVSTYVVRWWKVTTPDKGEFAYAAQSTPSLTLQTCVGAKSQYRLIVRLTKAG